MRTCTLLLTLCALAGSTPAWADEPAPSDDDAEVIVVTGLGRAERASRAVHATRVLDGDALRRTGAVSVADALEAVPGVQIVDGIGGEGVRLQGLDPEHTLILIDGMRVGGRVGGTLDLRRIPVDDIEQIEIVEGPSAILYGSDAVAGVVHIRTRRGEQGASAEARLITGRFLSPARGVDATVPAAGPVRGMDTLDATGSLSLGREGLRTRLNGGWHTGEATDIVPDDAGTTVNAYRQLQLGGTADLQVTPWHTWNVQGRWQSYRRWGIDSLPTGATLDRTNLTADWGLSLGPTIELSDQTRLSVQVGARGWTDQLRVDQRGSDTQDAYQRTEDVLGQTRVRYDTVLGDHHVVAVGVEALGERLTTDRIDPKTVGRTRLAAFVQDSWDVGGDDTWSVETSLRGDLDTRFGTYATPRIGVRWAPSTVVLARASAGRGFRAPDFREMFLVFENAASGYRVDGNEGLRPETSWNVQGGLQVQPASGLSLGLDVFHNDLQDLIQADLVDPGGPGQPQRFAFANIASARTTGGDAEVGLDRDGVGDLLLSYRFLDTRDRSTGLPLSGRARHQGSVAGTLRLPVWDGAITARGTWLGPRAFVRDDGSGGLEIFEAPAAPTLDLGLTLAPSPRLTVQAGLENAFDVGAVPDDLLQTRPRRVFLGLSGRVGTLPGDP